VRVVKNRQRKLRAEPLGRQPRHAEQRAHQRGRLELPVSAHAGDRPRTRAPRKPQQHGLGLIAPRMRRRDQLRSGALGEPRKRLVPRRARRRLEPVAGDGFLQAFEPLEEEGQAQPRGQ